jgi:hypothetical protein
MRDIVLGLEVAIIISRVFQNSIANKQYKSVALFPKYKDENRFADTYAICNEY